MPPSRLLSLALLLPLLPGCFMARQTYNEPLSATALSGLEPGRTTAAEVVEVLGAPAEVVQLGYRTAYRFDHTQTKRAGLWLLLVFLLSEDTHQDRVWAFFDADDVLSHLGTTLSAGDARYSLPWSQRYDYEELREAPAEPEASAAAQPGDGAGG